MHVRSPLHCTLCRHGACLVQDYPTFTMPCLLVDEPDDPCDFQVKNLVILTLVEEFADVALT